MSWTRNESFTSQGSTRTLLCKHVTGMYDSRAGRHRDVLRLPADPLVLNEAWGHQLRPHGHVQVNAGWPVADLHMHNTSRQAQQGKQAKGRSAMQVGLLGPLAGRCMHAIQMLICPCTGRA